MDYALRPHGIMYRAVVLSEDWYRSGFSPMIAYRAEDNRPVVLLPGKFGGYTWHDRDGNKVRGNKQTASQLLPDAICFYSSLPLEAIGVKGLLGYMTSCLNWMDFAKLLGLTLLVTLSGMLMPLITKMLSGFVLESGNGVILWGTAVFMLCVLVSSQLLTASRELAMSRIQIKVGVPMEAAMMSRLMSLPTTFFKQYSAGELASRSWAINSLSTLLLGGVLSTGVTVVASFLYVSQIFTYAPALGLPALVISLVSGLVLIAGGHDVQHGVLTIGTLNFFLNIGNMMFEPIRNFAGIFAEFQSCQAAAERVADVLVSVSEIEDKPEAVAKYGDFFQPKKENWEPIRGDVDFDHVSFWYQEGEPVLTDFDLHVKAGENIALVGETGGGKSTIVNLACRFYEPKEGAIYIDGVDYRERSQIWLQSNLGYVLQTPHLFSGSILENIRYGRLEATDEEVREAARLVGADEFIQKLEKGYDTDAGEGGSNMSTGQKQLISFARAILADPAIFVLDEATSSIDTETEQRIQAAADKLLRGRTSFIIAHRLSTVRNADRILVIDGGKVLEQGSHQELMAKKGRYWELYKNQFRREKLDQSVEELNKG